MFGLGTIINTVAIIAGGIIGLIMKKALSEKVQESVMMACGVAVLFIGIGGVMEGMLVLNPETGALSTQGSLMLIASLVVGILIGELLRLEEGIERFGMWLRKKSGNEGDNRFLDGFLTASLTVCIGAMAVVGSIQDGLLGDYSTLLAKAILDFIIVMIMAASMGKGCVFSAIPVALFQGSITLLSKLIEPVMTQAAISNISYVGSAMIFCVGLNLVWGKKVKVANMLPGLIIAVVWALMGW